MAKPTTNSIKSTEIASVTLSSPVITASPGAAHERRHRHRHQQHHETEPFRSARCVAALSPKRKHSPLASCRPETRLGPAAAATPPPPPPPTANTLEAATPAAAAAAAALSSTGQLNYGGTWDSDGGHAPGNSFVGSSWLRPKSAVAPPLPEAPTLRLINLGVKPTSDGWCEVGKRREPTSPGVTLKQQQQRRRRQTSLLHNFPLLAGLLVVALTVPSFPGNPLGGPLVSALKSIDDHEPLAGVPNELSAQFQPPLQASNSSQSDKLNQATLTSTATPVTSVTPEPRAAAAAAATTTTTTTLGDIFAKIASTFTARTVQTTTTTSTTTTTTTTTPKPTTTTTTTTTTAAEDTTSDSELDNDQAEEDDAGARDDDHDAASCKGLSAGEAAETTNLTDNARFVNLQTCLQAKVKRRLLATTLAGLQMFEKLALSGGCSSSLMSLATNLGETKSFAFKFLDASAKIPSGVMYGLLSDFGDFDQCLSIRSNPLVAPELEREENAYSGKYCLLNIKLKYRVHLAANGSLPEGIVEDGVLWDELVRNYWTSSSSKGFQMGVCVPSRCNQDDLDQIFQYFAASYNIQGQVGACQDSQDLRRQHTADPVQLAILCTFASLIALAILGTLLERYLVQSAECDSRLESSYERNPCKPLACRWASRVALAARVLVCFSINRNWRLFMRKHDDGCDLITASNLPTDQRDHQQLAGGPADKGALANTTDCSTSSSTLGSTAVVPVPTGPRLMGTSTTTTASTASSTASFINTSIDSTDSTATTGTTTTTTTTATSSPPRPYNQQLLIKVNTFESEESAATMIRSSDNNNNNNNDHSYDPLSHLSGLKLLVIVWITIGHSFLYPSANNYQYYRSIINMNITRDSVWFAGTNFTLGIDTLLYITGLVFVYKTARFSQTGSSSKGGVRQRHHIRQAHQGARPLDELSGLATLRLMLRKVLRFWPTYLAVIALALVVPLVSDGPMWPEMVGRRLGDSCRRHWWTNLLIVNNFGLSEPDICLPSSWFVSVLMQLFLVGSMIIAMVRRFSPTVAISMLASLLVASSVASFSFAHYYGVRAPVIRMDESFVMELDENIFRLYTSLFNNMGPFLVGMAGGFLLLRTRRAGGGSHDHREQRTTPQRSSLVLGYLGECLLALMVSSIAVLVLASVFYQEYSPLMSATYWALHRVGWAMVTGYLVHKCATGQWRLLYDLLSLSTFIPLSRLIFIAYLVYPIFIHVHSGLVRDGLHVSIYNMMNIYITRLVLTFTTALAIHLLVELPFCSLEEMFLGKMVSRRSALKESASREKIATRRSSQCNLVHPLLVVAPNIELKVDGQLKSSGNNPSMSTNRGGGDEGDRVRHTQQGNINQSSTEVNMGPVCLV